MMLKKTYLALTGALLCSASLHVHAGLFEDDEARKAILDLRKELREANAAQDKRQEQSSAELEKALEQKWALTKKELLELVEQKTDLSKRNQLELNQQLNQSKEEQAKLRGQVELLSNEVAQLQRQLRDVETALDARLKKLEPRVIAIDGKETVVDKAEETAFNNAMNQFKAGDYKAASNAFQAYVTQYPSSTLLASAYFWLGNSQYANRDVKAGLASLQTMLQKSPNHPRAGDAYLTMGHCLNELGDKTAAQKAFSYVVETFPNTAAAESAKQHIVKPSDKAADKGKKK